jgi:hypothetical protein
MVRHKKDSSDVPITYEKDENYLMREYQYRDNLFIKAVLRIRIHRIHMFLGLLDPNPDP